jgi:O-antigen ligase
MMPAVAADAAPRLPASRLDRAAFALLLAFVASLQVSIAAANILLGLTAICWLALVATGRLQPAAPPFFLPLVAYAAATLVSAVFSVEPQASLIDSRQLLLFAVAPLVCTLVPRRHALAVLTLVVTVGALSAVFGVVQYAMLHYDTLGRRPDGALTHYMTYSGTLMLALCATAAQLIFGTRERTWPGLVLPALAVALALTFTRSAWIGACVAAGLLLMLRDLRLIAVLPVVIALAFALAPDAVTGRMLSIFDLRDPSNRDRVAMMRAGTAMIADDPLTGVGPDMVPRVYATYRRADAVNAETPHLHNVPIQIAAERGLPALAVWGWFVVACLTALYRLVRANGGGNVTVCAAAGLAAMAAMLAAGLFEYNFGDSEFLMLLLVLVSLPFTRDRGPEAHRAGPAGSAS